MIVYKYSFYQDLKLFLHNRKKRRQLEAKGIVVIKFKLSEYIKILLKFWKSKLNLPSDLNVEENIICYIVSSGTWGAYELPDKIFICPIEMEKLSSSLEELILHEVVHLRLEKNIEKNSFEEKERRVNEEVEKILKVVK